MEAPATAAAGVAFGGSDDASTNGAVDLERVFSAQYRRIARLIARVIRDPGRAEELAVDVFLKWSDSPAAHGPHTEGWLYRTATRLAIDELRRQVRRERFEWLLVAFGGRHAETPEDVHAGREEQSRVRCVLARLPRREAALLVLRSDGFSYAELGATLGLNAGSVGTLLARAQRKFKQEYIRRYGGA